jgi:leucyl aminopeptidase
MDLVLLEPSELDRLRASDLPVIWKGASFFLAEWNGLQQEAAREHGIRFELLRRGSDPAVPLYLFELPQEHRPAADWGERTLFRTGRKWVLEAPSEKAREWMAQGYSGIPLPRVSRGWTDATPEVTYACAYNPVIDDLLAQTTTTQWLDWIEKLSGAEPITVGNTDHVTQTRHSSHMFSGDPTARAFDFAVQQIQSWHYPPADLELDPYTGLGGQTWQNLVLTIPGQTLPQEVVLLTGHLDSITFSSTSPAPGANDNGSGIATLFEAARLLRQLRFERTIQIVWFTGEEDGLIGSEAFVADHPMGNVLGVVNLDMFGWDGDGDRCFEIHAGTIPASQDVGVCFSASIDSYGLGLTRDFLTSGATDRSDHASFWQVGVGAIEISENFFSDGLVDGCVGSDANPAYHTTSDTMANVTGTFGFDIARAGLATIAAMAIPVGACFDQAPAVSVTPGVSSVSVEWSPVPGANAYRVYRSTAGCEGQWFEIAETPETIWLDPAADEARPYFYQVEAVDADGVCVSPASSCATATPTVYHASQDGATPVDVCAAGGTGSGDGIIDPGESVVLPVTLINDGNMGLSSVSGTFSTSESGITVVDAVADWPDLAESTSVESLPDHFGFQVGEGLGCGAAFDVNIDLVYSEGSNSTGLTLTTGTVEESLLLSEDFTAGIPASWTVVDGGAGGLLASTWTSFNPGNRSIDPPFDSPFVIVDSDNAGTSATQDESLIGPVLDASQCSQVTLEFSNQFRWYSGGLDERGDVDVSTDGGATWQNVLRLDGGSDGYSAPNTKSVDITAAIVANPSSFEFRFRYYQAQYEWWWAVDNVLVRCARELCTPCAAGAGAPGEPVKLTIELVAEELVFQWNAPDAVCGTTDYAVYRGDLTSLHGGSYAHDTVVSCQVEGSSLVLPLDDPQVGMADYYLVIASNGVQEGSYGRDSDALERPASLQCQPAQNLASCAP